MRARIRTVPISALVLDVENANKGRRRGRELLEASLDKYGAGRSVLVDRHDRVIAGNKTVEAARAAGMESITVIETDGSSLVAVRRGDLDLKKDKKARELAIADNRVGELDLEWNPEVLATLNVDLKQKVLLISEPDNESGRYSEIILMVVDAVGKVRQIIVGLKRSEPQIAIESEIQAASRQDCN